TVIAAVGIILVHQLKSRRQTISRSLVVVLFLALFCVLGLYLALRAQSSAVPLNFSGGACCSYTLSLRVFLGNVVEYLSRTYTLLVHLAGAVAIWLVARGRKINMRSLNVRDVLLSLTLFGFALAPFILMRENSGIYSYMAGIGASLLVGVFV